MNFNFLPSLLHMASVKIVSHLLRDQEIRAMLDNEITLMHPFQFFQSGRQALWKFIEKRAETKLPLLPPSLPNKVAKILQPMHFEVVMWLEDHVFIFPGREDFCTNYMSFLYWRTDGTIDREQTAKKIVHSEIVDISDRFKLACNYFLMDEILNLWDRIKEEGIIKIPERQTNTAVRFWTMLLQEGSNRPLNELIEEYFRPSSIMHMDIPLRLSSYFQFLPTECRRDYLVNNGYRLHKDDFRLCLYQMDEKERRDLFQSIPGVTLKQSLIWPFQSLFIKLATDLAKYMLLADFIMILDHILVYYIVDGYDYYEEFKEFWNIIPEFYKNEIKKDDKRYRAFQRTLSCDNKLRVSKFMDEVLQEYDFD